MSKSFDWGPVITQLIAAIMPLLIKAIADWLEGELEKDEVSTENRAALGVDAIKVLQDADKVSDPADWLSINRSEPFGRLAQEFSKQTGTPIIFAA